MLISVWPGKNGAWQLIAMNIFCCSGLFQLPHVVRFNQNTLPVHLNCSKNVQNTLYGCKITLTRRQEFERLKQPFLPFILLLFDFYSTFSVKKMTAWLKSTRKFSLIHCLYYCSGFVCAIIMPMSDIDRLLLNSNGRYVKKTKQSCF